MSASPERPICRGQEWEVHAALKTTTATVLGPPILSRGQAFVPVARDHLAPSMEPLDLLMELRAVPGGPTLEAAREMRRTRENTGRDEPGGIEPALLHSLAEAEVAAAQVTGHENAPQLAHLTADLYRHALYEAGGFVHGPDPGLPFDPCPVCGYRQDGSVPVAAEPNPARWLPEPGAPEPVEGAG